MIGRLKKYLSPNWKQIHVVETSEGKHRYDSAETARITEWVYAHGGIPTERYTEWEYVGDDSARKGER